MTFHLPEAVMEDIIRLAERNNIQKVILFGSRAKGANRDKSDIDLAASGGDASAFYLDLEEFAHTLLTFDVVDLDGEVSAELEDEIQREGVVIYEKV